MRSPFQAWPEQHLHHGPAGRTVTTPLPGLGPRLVELLARHRSSALPPDDRPRRYGPAAALRELLAAGHEVALEAVMRPEPLSVHCGGEWHRVGLAEGELELHDHVGIDVDSELVAGALTGSAPEGCLRLVHLWRQRDGATVPASLGSLPIFDAARAWRDAGECLERRDAWLAQAWSPASVARAEAIDVDGMEMLRWLPVTRLPGVAREWRAAGWTVGEAVRLMSLFSPEESAHWRAAGLDVNRIFEARRGGLSLREATAWHRTGWPLLMAGALAARGCAPRDADELLSVVGRRGIVLMLVRGGVLEVGDLPSVYRVDGRVVWPRPPT